jgi:hypothetical protein
MSSAPNNTVEAPKGATDAVLVQSEEMPADTPLIEGPDFNKVLSLSDLLATYKYMGFQASGLGKAIDIVEKMVSWFGLSHTLHYLVLTDFWVDRGSGDCRTNPSLRTSLKSFGILMSEPTPSVRSF